jgi:ABC-2 type transport system ATP-binding protein
MPLIEVEHLAKTYRVAQKKKSGIGASLRGLFHREMKDVSAVADISFRIEEGEMVAFLGPNGAGKTTTLKMLSGLIYPTSGSARVLGFVPWERANEYRRQFALVMGQKNQLWWDLPARESFRLHREIYAIPPDVFQRTHDELIDLLRLGNLINQPVRELSLGERMKMELVAALLHQPRVLFLDEPTIGLDVVAQSQLRDFLRDYNNRQQVTMLLTSHYMKDVESLCDRTIVINHGRLIYDGSLTGILAKFTRFKMVKLQFEESVPNDLARYGEVVEVRGPVATLRMDRQAVANALSNILSRHRLDDITVDEIPLEEVIAEVFQAADENRQSLDAPVAGAARS